MIDLFLDIDGVMVTTPSWKTPELLEDGFMRFDALAVQHLARILALAETRIILTSTHRVHYTATQWEQIFSFRNIFPSALSKIDEAAETDHRISRCILIEDWFERNNSRQFLILDDDSSLQGLRPEIKARWIQTAALKGLDADAFNKALQLLTAK